MNSEVHASIAQANVLIIGGGPAGSLAATMLARSGIGVTLVEQHRFPRDKVCGECLSALGREVLERHSLESSLADVGVSLTRAVLHGRHDHSSLTLPSPMLGISRALMDEFLLTAARDAGATVLQPGRVESCIPSASQVDVTVRDLTSNAVRTISVDYVLAADGRGAWLQSKPTPTAELGVKAHFKNVAADASAITLYGGMGCYGGVAPIENGRWNVAFSVPRQLILLAKGDLDEAWRRITRQSAAMSDHFKTSTRVSEWLASPLPRHQIAKSWHPRMIPIGAAACAIEPVGGEGMGTALRSAELAVEALLQNHLETLPADYRKLWARRSLFCRLGGAALAAPAWSDAIAFVRSDSIARLAMHLVGK